MLLLLLAVEVVFVDVEVLRVPRVRAALKWLWLQLTLIQRSHIADFHIKLLTLAAAEIDSEILRLHEFQPIAFICSDLRVILLLLVMLIKHIRQHRVGHAILHNVHFIIVIDVGIAVRFRVNASVVVVVVLVHRELTRVVRRVDVRRVEHVEAMWIARNNLRASNQCCCCVRRGRWLTTSTR